MSDNCPCGSDQLFELCCEPYLIGRKPAPTAEALMRSRFTAYALCSIDYLYKTSGKKVRKQFDAESTERWAAGSTWEGIEFLSIDGGDENDTKATLEFIARYNIEGHPRQHHEVAEFAKIDGEWYFIDGEIAGGVTYRREEPKVGRNDPCPCGSGKKHKKCCANLSEGKSD